MSWESLVTMYNFYGFDRWFQSHGVQIVIVLLVAFLARLLGSFVIENIFIKAIHLRKSAQLSRRQRAETVAQLLNSALTGIILIAVVFTVLAQFQIDIVPLLAGAGFVGVALVVSAQQLIKDMTAGFFIISENQYKIGDYICLVDVCGVVKDITLRITVLQDLDGAVHYVPNSSFARASNHSIDYTRIGLTLGVRADANLEQVIKVINQVGTEMAADPQWRGIVIEPPYFDQVKDFVNDAMVLKVTGKIKPLAHLKVEAELRKRIKIAFDRSKIAVMQPQ